MALAPLRTGPHAVRADRLAFATPVREAAGGHWITLGHHGDDEEGGGVHVYIGGGSGPGSGTIIKGPKGLLGHHIAALASHPSVSKAQHHPVGHEPPGARDHPHYAEATPNAERQTPSAGQEPTKRPGKPYARLHGAEQGTRHEQIGKALSEAQEAARGAKAAKGQDTATPTAADEHLAALPEHVRTVLREAGVKIRMHQGSQATALPGHGASTPMAKLGPVDAGYDSRTGTAHFFGGKADRYDVHHEMGHALDDALGYRATGKHHTPYSSLPEFQALYRKHKDNDFLPPTMRTSASEMFADAFARHHDVEHQEGERADGEPRMVHRGRKLEREAPDLRAHMAALSNGSAAPQPHPFAAPEAKVADTAVAHQQAQAELAAHRAKNDRNPNPWAPHLSPPVGDAKDRELAEKATRAQLAHQAAQAQQQGAQQQEQQEGQRAHEKEMLRLKAEAAQPKPAFSAPQAKEKAQTLPQPEQPASAPKLQGSAAQEVARMEAALPRRSRPLAGDQLTPAVQHARRDTVEHGRVLAARLAQTAGQTPNLEVLPHGKVKADTLAEMNSQAGKLPQHYKDLHHAYGTHTFVGGTGSKEGAAPTIAKSQARAYGVFAPQLREVHVHPGAVKSGRGAHVLHHELGHATDHALGALRAAQGEPFSKHPGAWLDRLHNPSQTSEALALHAKHRDNELLSPNMRQNSDEFFADAFAMHHTQPDRLKEAAPDVAEYMQRIDKEAKERVARARGR